jgi:hypothetical protein
MSVGSCFVDSHFRLTLSVSGPTGSDNGLSHETQFEESSFGTRGVYAARDRERERERERERVLLPGDLKQSDKNLMRARCNYKFPMIIL